MCPKNWCRYTPWAFYVCAGAAVLLYAGRRGGVSAWVGWAGVGLALAVSAGLVVRRVRASWLGRREARVWLEHTLALDTRLSAAAAGVCAWPPLVHPWPLRWRWQAGPVAGWLAGGAALVLAAGWLPLPPDTRASARETGVPPALAQAEAWLRELAEQRLAEPASVDKLAAEVRALAEQEAAQRFSHAGLEAADQARGQTAAAMTDLAERLEEAARALAESARAESLGATAGEGAAAAAGGRLQAALGGLAEGKLGAPAELRAALAQALAEGRPGGTAAGAGGQEAGKPGQAGQRTPGGAGQVGGAAAREALAERLRQAGKGVRGVAGAAGAGVQIAAAEGEVTREGRSWAGGKPKRGPGQAPYALATEASDAGAGRLEGVSGEDLSRAALGDLLEVTTGRPENREAEAAGAAAAKSGGALSGPRSGGEAAWVDRLTPQERAVLKDFFK